MSEKEGTVIVGMGELKDIVRQALREELATVERDPEFLNKEKVAELLGCRPSSIATYVSRDSLPVAGRCGRILLFSRRDVISWAEQRGTKPRRGRPSTNRGSLQRVK